MNLRSIRSQSMFANPKLRSFKSPRLPALPTYRHPLVSVNGNRLRQQRSEFERIRANKRPGTVVRWSRLGSNQRPPACEAGALPLSYETACRTGERRRRLTRDGISAERAACGQFAARPLLLRNLCGHTQVDYRRASHRATISSVACGCSAVGSASPCQGEGRGFESRHPLEGANGINPSGGVAEW